MTTTKAQFRPKGRLMPSRLMTKARVDAEGPVDDDDDSACGDADVVAFAPKRHGDGEAVPAASACPAAKAKKAVKKDQGDLTPCEIDAGNALLKVAGTWDLAMHVIETLKNVAGG